jgi:CBS domain-containing protein
LVTELQKDILWISSVYYFLHFIYLKGAEIMMKINNVLQSKSKNIWTIHPRETAYYALEIMAEKNIGSLPVIDKEK